MKNWIWKLVTRAAFIASFVMLLAVSAAHGQQTPLAVYPPNLTVGQPITFSETTEPYVMNTVYIIPAVNETNCLLALDESTPIVSLPPVRSDMNGNFTVTLAAGLSIAGSYEAATLYVQPNGSAFTAVCDRFTVSPVKPMPEFNETLIVFSLSLATLYCILKGKRRKG
jgi:hypothetical protein